MIVESFRRVRDPLWKRWHLGDCVHVLLAEPAHDGTVTWSAYVVDDDGDYLETENGCSATEHAAEIEAKRKAIEIAIRNGVM